MSRFGLAVRHWAGRQKGLGSIPLWLSFLLKVVVVCGHHSSLCDLDIVHYWEVAVWQSCLLEELFLCVLLAIAKDQLELLTEDFCLCFWVGCQVAIFPRRGSASIGWLPMLDVAPEALVLGSLIRCGIISKDSILLFPVWSANLSLHHVTEGRDLTFQFISASFLHSFVVDSVPLVDVSWC